jgi:hypothetical protein
LYRRALAYDDARTSVHLDTKKEINTFLFTHISFILSNAMRSYTNKKNNVITDVGRQFLINLHVSPRNNDVSLYRSSLISYLNFDSSFLPIAFNFLYTSMSNILCKLNNNALIPTRTLSFFFNSISSRSNNESATMFIVALSSLSRLCTYSCSTAHLNLSSLLLDFISEYYTDESSYHTEETYFNDYLFMHFFHSEHYLFLRYIFFYFFFQFSNKYLFITYVSNIRLFYINAFNNIVPPLYCRFFNEYDTITNYVLHNPYLYSILNTNGHACILYNSNISYSNFNITSHIHNTYVQQSFSNGFSIDFVYYDVNSISKYTTYNRFVFNNNVIRKL